MAGCCAFTFCLVSTQGLLSHEETDGALLRELEREIRRDGVLREPVVVDGGSLVILDGHHRVSVLRNMGCALVPAYLVDYSDPGISVGPWRPDATVTKEEVILAGRTGRRYPPKTSRHEFPGLPGARPVALGVLAKLSDETWVAAKGLPAPVGRLALI
jgi:hypothetical protein